MVPLATVRALLRKVRKLIDAYETKIASLEAQLALTKAELPVTYLSVTSGHTLEPERILINRQELDDIRATMGPEDLA